MTAITIFKEFLLLGCLSFGGPAAHIGFFRRRFVEELKWFSDREYGDMVALCHFLPGPSSSQVGFSIGLRMAGIPGACAAFIGFTAPSFLIMLGLVFGSELVNQTEWFYAILHGLKFVAVIVVFDAIVSMGAVFCAEQRTRVIAATACAAVVFFNSAIIPLLCILIGALLGYFLRTEVNPSKEAETAARPLEQGSHVGFALIIFLLLLIGLPLLSHKSDDIELFTTFFQVGSFVFGGGHVVLPLLQSSLGNTVGNEQLLTAYAAAQAVPGPMFTIATYLGGISSVNTVFSALTATVAIFLPGFLLVLALQHSWGQISQYKAIASAIWGINASVVGILAAAFFTFIVPDGLRSLPDIFICLLGVVALRFLKLPIVLLIAIVLGLTLVA